MRNFLNILNAAEDTWVGFFVSLGVSQNGFQALFRALWCRMFQAQFQNSYPLTSSYFFHANSQITLGKAAVRWNPQAQGIKSAT